MQWLKEINQRREDNAMAKRQDKTNHKSKKRRQCNGCKKKKTMQWLKDKTNKP